MFLKTSNLFSRIGVRYVSTHTSQLNNEVLNVFKDCSTVFDLTFGDGVQSTLLLEKGHHVFGLDQDDTVVDRYHQNCDKKFIGRIGKFSDIPSIVKQNDELQKWTKSCDGILLDLGISQAQLNSSRGFNMESDEPLDLRMNGSGPTAAEVIEYLDMESIIKIFKVYGGVTCAKNIVTDIIERRYLNNPIKTSIELFSLVNSCLSAVPHFETENQKELIEQNTMKVFLALRLFVNNELNELNFVIKLARTILGPGSKLAVVLRSEKEEAQFRNLIFSEANDATGLMDWRLDNVLEEESGKLLSFSKI